MAKDKTPEPKPAKTHGPLMTHKHGGKTYMYRRQQKPKK